jgi:ligand-binding sensor domain-containing protein
MRVNTGSDLLEVELTEEEAFRASQLGDRELTIILLQNTRVGIFRQLATQQFSKPDEDEENHRVRSYWKGQYDILGTILDEAMKSAPSATGNSPINPITGAQS